MLFRKIMILLLVVFFMALVVFSAVMFLTNEEMVYEDNGVSLTIEKPTFITLSEPAAEENGSGIAYIRDMTLLGLDVGSYTLTERTLENGVTIVFEEIKNTGWLPFAISLNQNELKDAEVTSWNPENAAPPVDEVFGEDLTSNPFGTIKAGSIETLQGNLYVSRDIKLGNGEAVHELRHENPNLVIEEGVLLKNFWLPPKHKTQTWMIISENPLFESAAAEQEWIDFSQNNPFQRLNWLTPAGPIVKLPLTDDPRTQTAYGFIEERTDDPTSREWNESSPSLFFESMVLNADINSAH